ncbi:MAG TPA: hypothetical protein H9834_02435 [Candidatus Barnesiella excrementavium]|nr:hypothetical protein [Candidatus Barnesiella excrementavium]
MKRAILVWSVILFLGLPMSISAQQQKDADSQQRKAKFEQFCQFRRDYMQKQIGLTDQEAQQFFTLYEELEAKKWKIDKEARDFARRVARSKSPVSDTEYEKAAQALLEKDEKMAQLDREYYDKFKTFLSSEKLFKFKNAQMKFPRAMMKWQGGKNGQHKGRGHK